MEPLPNQDQNVSEEIDSNDEESFTSEQPHILTQIDYLVRNLNLTK